MVKWSKSMGLYTCRNILTQISLHVRRKIADQMLDELVYGMPIITEILVEQD